MKSLIALAAAFAATSFLPAARAAGLDDVKSAADKLAAADNYSWTQTVDSAQFRPGPSHGKTEKGGFTYVDFSVRDDTIEAVIKDGKGAIKTDDGWVTLDAAAKSDGGGGGGFNPSTFIARRLQNYKLPAGEAADMAGMAKEITKGDDVYSGDLTEDGAKKLLTFGRGRRGGGGNGGQPPPVSNAKGTVKFWVKDGVLTNNQYKVQGTMKNRDGDDMDVDRTTTVDIHDVGTTKVSVPDEAKSKIS